MTSCLNNILCCAGNCVCSGLNKICEDSMKLNPKLFSRIGFICLSFTSVTLSLVVLYFAAGLLKPFNDFIQCPKDNNFDCLGISSVYRMSLSLVLLHLTVILFSLCGKTYANAMNKDCWSFKFFFVFGLYIAFFFVPNSFFTVYAEISRYLSLLFLVYQIIVTISFAHVINIKLVEGLDRTGEFKYKFWLIFLSLLFLSFAFYWIGMSYWYYSDSFYNIVLISICTLLLGSIFTFVSVSSLVTQKRLLTSIYIFSFISYLTWSALNSQPNENIKLDNKLSFIDIFDGLFYLFIALSFLGFYIKKTPKFGSDDVSEEQKQINKNPMLEEENKKDEELMNRGEQVEVASEETSIASYYFHVFMMFMSLYYCMLLTNWSAIDPNTSNPILMPQNWTSFWLKITSVIVTCLLYSWILIAPRIFPDREFDF